nr:hypothetical protein [Tanacetum cinerariifolium]
KAYATLQSHYDKLTNDLRKSQFDVLSYKTGLESVEARLLVYQQNETIFEEDIKLLKVDVELRDNALVALRQKFEKAEQERDELNLKLEKFQTSSKNLSQLLASQTNDKTRLSYDNQVFTSSMFDYDEMFSFEFNVSMPASLVYDRYHSGEGYHVVPPPYTGTFIPPKPDLVFHDAPNVHIAFNVELSLTKSDKDLPHSHRPSAPIIEDWVSDSEDEYEAEPTQNASSFVHPPEHVKPPRPSVKPAKHPIPANNLRKNSPKSRGHSNSRTNKACSVLLTRSKLVPLTAARLVTTVVPYHYVTRPRPAKTVVTKPHSPPRRTINHSSSPKPNNFPLKVTTVKAPKVNAVKGVHGNWDKGVMDSGCLRYMTGNMSYLSDFKAINGGYVAFGGNPKGGKITGKGNMSYLSDFEELNGGYVAFEGNPKGGKISGKGKIKTLMEMIRLSIRSNAIALDSPYFLVLITGMSQSRQHEPTAFRLRRDLIILRSVPRLGSSGPSSAFNVYRRETICFGLYIVLSDDMRGLRRISPKDSRENHVIIFHNFNSVRVGTEFEVTGFDKACVSPTVGKIVDLSRGVTAYSLCLEEEGGFPKIDCFANLVFVLVPVVSF